MQEIKSSFRDPSGQIFADGDEIVRLINPEYFADYDRLMSSGLYDELVDLGLLIPHKEVRRYEAYIEIKPVVVPFISYPYEWCFSMLKEAALNTLWINRIAMEHGMILRDAPAYNMQWHEGTMLLIDTLSFMEYKHGILWGAYRQFLQHFVHPLLLMAYRDCEFGKLSQIYLDGIPAQQVARLLPFRLRFKPVMWAHVYSQALNFAVNPNRSISMRITVFNALYDSLERFVDSLKYKPKSKITKYAEEGSYTDKAVQSKKAIIQKLLSVRGVHKTLCDMGCNTGEYSFVARHFGNYKVIAIDSDHDCIEKCCNSDWLSLVVDLCNPSPAIGFDNQERQSFLDRLHVDTLMALALIHHLCVGNNVPLARVAELLAGHCKRLIIEFVPLDDPKAKLLLGKKHIPPYSLDIFKEAFGKYFTINGEYPVEDSLRTIYDMGKK